MSSLNFGTIEWLGLTPNDWNTIKLKHIFIEHYKKNTQKNKQIISLSYGKTKYRDLSNNFGLLPESFESYNLIKPGYLVFRLTDLQNDKTSLRIGLNNLFGAITSAYTVLKINKKNHNINYYSYLLKSFDFLKFIYNLGGGVRQGANFNDLKNIIICCPPLPQQTAIANYLDHHTSKIDKEISLLEQKVEKLDEYKQALIYETVTKGLDKNVPMKDSGIEWIGMIPEHWEVKRVKDLFSTLNKSLISSGDADEDGKYDFYISGAKLKKSNIFNLTKEALLLPTGGSYMVHYPKTLPCAYSTDVLPIIGNKKVNLKFAFYLLSHNKYYFNENYFWGSGLKHLQRNAFFNSEIIIASKNEQQQIAEYLDEQSSKIDNKKELINKKIELLKEYKQSLIYEAVTGKIEIGE